MKVLLDWNMAKLHDWCRHIHPLDQLYDLYDKRSIQLQASIHFILPLYGCVYLCASIVEILFFSMEFSSLHYLRMMDGNVICVYCLGRPNE